MAAKSYSAGVKEYRETYWEPDYAIKDTDFLACFKYHPAAGCAARRGRRRGGRRILHI